MIYAVFMCYYYLNAPAANYCDMDRAANPDGFFHSVEECREALQKEHEFFHRPIGPPKSDADVGFIGNARGVIYYVCKGKPDWTDVQ